MSSYSKTQIDKIFQSENFINNYNEYKSNNDSNLIDFLNNIQLNKKYFRLEVNKNNYKKNKFKHKNIGDDTSSIKEVNGFLNKLTDKTYLKIRLKIKELLKNKEYLTELIIENILEKCIVYTSYIQLYIDLTKYLYSDNDNLNLIILKTADKLYDNINNATITESSDYLIFCEKNKKLDKLIGYSLLITELEKNNIIRDRIHNNLNNFIKTLSECDNDEEKYKCVQCLYNIFKSYYDNKPLSNNYNEKLQTLINIEKSMKIKFKMMDIIERK